MHAGVSRRTPVPPNPRALGPGPCTGATRCLEIFPMTDNLKIINQLRALLLLTHTEEQVARTRVAQARTDAVRRELSQNADHAAERTQAIAEQLRALGGVPDVVTPAVGRLAAVLKATFEHVVPLEEALLQDLQLEH